MRVEWTSLAKEQVTRILDYCVLYCASGVAGRLAEKFNRNTFLLEQNPYLGSVEQLLHHKKKEYRCLIEGYYKMIYYIENDIVYIAALWDCRQEPCKLTKRIK